MLIVLDVLDVLVNGSGGFVETAAGMFLRVALRVPLASALSSFDKSTVKYPALSEPQVTISRPL